MTGTAAVIILLIWIVPPLNKLATAMRSIATDMRVLRELAERGRETRS